MRHKNCWVKTVTHTSGHNLSLTKGYPMESKNAKMCPFCHNDVKLSAKRCPCGAGFITRGAIKLAYKKEGGGLADNQLQKDLLDLARCKAAAGEKIT